MKILITGIAGFVGSSLARAFKNEGHTILGVDNLHSGYASNVDEGITWEKRDIRHENAFDGLEQNFEVIIHAAAQSSGEKSFDDPIYDMDTNLKGSYLTYQFAKKCESRIMVNFSSMSVYGQAPHRSVVDENTIPKPISLYGNTKLAAENLLHTLSAQDQIPVVSLRLFNAYGPSQDLTEMKQGMVSIYLSYLLNYEKIQVKGSSERVRDFIFIDDIFSAIQAIIHSENPQTGFYNLSTNTITSVLDLISLMKEITGFDKPVLYEGYTPGDILGFQGANQKLQQTFSWQPKVLLKDGLKNMIESYQNY